MTKRDEIVAHARSCKGTRFDHMGRTPQVALDCAGLLISCARATGLVEPTFDVPAYLDVPDGSSMFAACSKFMVPTTQSKMQAGDAILVAILGGPQHLGVLGLHRYGCFSIIHASNKAKPPRVVETRLMFSPNLRFVAAFAFPGV